MKFTINKYSKPWKIFAAMMIVRLFQDKKNPFKKLPGRGVIEELITWKKDKFHANNLLVGKMFVKIYMYNT